ncbi:hypothetical protein BC937DRAFT_94631 [Endogone sp. FLAS-F59071]|nr:hypothetical protein BC937DRAFT_94631 [Endogone sp. FLAS-F59071]|eukprot:RUS13886.1 hypothetical protein BC937DRAFT_94631 [Endogone sp. FLAS-F59071]
MSRLLTCIAKSRLKPSKVIIALRDFSSSSILPAANQGSSSSLSPTFNQEPLSNASNSTTSPPARPVTRLIFSDDSPEEPKITTHPTTASEPWTGDERVEDTILRMLIDKYNKPLRVEGAAIRAIPKPAPDHPRFVLDQLVTRKPVAESLNGSEEEVSSAVKARERAARARTRLQDRVTGARDKALDYKLKKDWPAPAAAAATMTTNLGSATTVPITDGEITPQMIMQHRRLVDVRIEAARARGDFDNLSGRGKPLPYDHHAQNPFLDSSEYLMNRLVQRQGGVPPWIEMQGEVDREVEIFRRALGDGWKRVIRSGEDVESKRVRKEWEQAQQVYVNTAVQRLNNRIRSYNIICPMNVQRPFMTVEKEFQMVYEVGERYEKSESEKKKAEKETMASWKTNDGEKKEERAKTRAEGFWTSLFKNLG